MAITGNQKAYMPALSGIGRSGAIRSGAFPKTVFISIGGVPLPPLGSDPTTRVGVLLGSLTITDNLDEAANRCTFRLTNAGAAQGQEIVITMGSKNNLDRLFAGHVVDTTQLYAGKPANVQTDIAAVDYTWQLGFTLVTERYTNQSATAIVVDLLAKYGAVNGFGRVPLTVADGLPVINEITFTDEPLVDCFTRLARRIGGYWYVDYQKLVHLFLEDTSRPAPTPLTPTHPSFNNFTHEVDSSQTLTRVYVEGRGTKVLSAVPIGETSIPVEAVDMFTPAADVFLKVSFQGSDGGAQHLNFSGVVPGGAGTLVGPGIGPSSALTAVAVSGASSIEAGAHFYSYTFVTAAGESLQAPARSVGTGAVPDPLVAPGPVTQAPTGSNGSFIAIGHSISFAYSYGTGTPSVSDPHTLISPSSGPITTVSNHDPLNPAHSAPITVPVPYSTNVSVKQVFVWVRDPATTGANFVSYGNVLTNNPTGGTFYVGGAGSNIFPANPVAPTTNTTGATVVNLSNIGIGPATVTARKLYRTIANGGALKFLATLPNNTATTYSDTASDSALGANAPSGDTSGLQQPDGQVVAGSDILPIAGSSAFQTGGGWAIIGNGEQVIRYTSVTPAGITLVGIPTSGPGAITATIAYNSTVTAAPMLTGIPTSGAWSLSTRALVAGDELYLVVQVDELGRQAELAAAVGGSGIREEWIQDRRLSIGEARARGQATLALRPFGTRSIAYTCRDLNTAAGKTITVNLPAPTNVVGLFKIQQVTISNFRPHPEQPPTFAVQASSVRFSFEDLLRSIKTKE